MPTRHGSSTATVRDFPTQAKAQKFFLNHGGPRRDPHLLDADGDGVACVTNPCPCNFSKSNGGKGKQGKKGKKVIRQKARVISVVDGDTVNVKIRKGRKASVRIIGIDTPEVYGDVECGGPEASDSAKRMLEPGDRVRLVSDPTQQVKDRYGRLLRYIFRGTKDIGRAQVRRGWARVYVYNHKPFQKTRAYKASQARAKRSGKGIWDLC